MADDGEPPSWIQMEDGRHCVKEKEMTVEMDLVGVWMCTGR